MEQEYCDISDKRIPALCRINTQEEQTESNVKKNKTIKLDDFIK